MITKIKSKYNALPIQIRASFWFLICRFLQKGISVITTPIFTRLMTTAEYGQYNVFNSWLNIVSIVVTINLSSGMYTRGLVKYSDRKEKFSSSLQILTLLLTICWTLIYVIFHKEINNYSSLTTLQMLAMFVMIWTTAAFTFWIAEQRVDLNYQKLVTLTVIASIAKPLLGIILVINLDDKVTARIIGLAIVELIIYTGCFISQVKRGGIHNIRCFWKDALLFNIPLIPHYLSMTILNGADKIMIERMIGASESGIYSLAYSVAMVMGLFNSALIDTIVPWLYKKINVGDIKSIGKVAYPSWLLIGGINLLLIILAPELVSFFAPKPYHDAIWIIPPVALSQLFIFLYNFFSVFEFFYAKTTLVAIASCAGAVLNIILNYIFLPIFGYYAAGYTTLICYIVYALMHYLFMKNICKKELGINEIYDKKILIGFCAAYLVVGISLIFTYKYPMIRYGIAVVCVVLMIIYRKNIISAVKKFMDIRKEKNNVKTH